MNDDAQKARSYADAMLAARGPCARCVDFAARGADLQMKLEGTLMGLAAASVEHTSMRARIAELEAVRRENALIIEALQRELLQSRMSTPDEADISDAADNDGVPSPGRSRDRAEDETRHAIALRVRVRELMLREHHTAVEYGHISRAEAFTIAREAVDREIGELRAQVGDA